MASAAIAIRVLRGESPAQIPFEPVLKTRLTINLAAAAQSEIAVPESLIRSATEVIR